MYKTRPDAAAAARWSWSSRLTISASAADKTSTFRALNAKTSDLRMASSSRYRRAWLIALSNRLQGAAPNAPPRPPPGRCQLQSPPGWRDSMSRLRATERESNAGIRGQFPPGTCPSCTSPRFAVRSIPSRQSRPSATYARIPIDQRTDFHTRRHGSSLPLASFCVNRRRFKRPNRRFADKPATCFPATKRRIIGSVPHAVYRCRRRRPTLWRTEGARRA